MLCPIGYQPFMPKTAVSRCSNTSVQKLDLLDTDSRSLLR
jgi:hypothetical protein